MRLCRLKRKQLHDAITVIQQKEAEKWQARVAELEDHIKFGEVEVRTKGQLGGQHKITCKCRHCVEQDCNRQIAMNKLVAFALVGTIRQHLQMLISSAEVFIDSEDTITRYKVKTGALHKLFGVFAGDKNLTPLSIPTNLPEALATDIQAQESEKWQARVAELEGALIDISKLDYTRAAVNHCAYEAHRIASQVLANKSDWTIKCTK